MLDGVAKPIKFKYVAVMLASPASGRSSRKRTDAGRPGPPMATGTGASVWLVSVAILPSCITGLLVFFSRCTMSSALPWSAVTRNTPPSSSTALSRMPTCASTTSHAFLVASKSPVWPTMSGLA